MKYLSLICAGLLLLGVANLPYQYYTVLKIVVSIGALWMVIEDYKNRANLLWILIFGAIAVYFNPIIPFDFGTKENRVFICILVSILFFLRTIRIKENIRKYQT